MLNNQKILISGASGTLGAALAKSFAAEGAKTLALFYGSKTEAVLALEKACRNIGAQNVFSICADVRNCASVSRGFAGLDEKGSGELDRAVLCAGITADAPVATMTPEQWQTVVDTNLTGTKNMLIEVARRMKRGGNIIVIGSIRGFTGARGQANYSASKAGLIGLVRAAARELGKENIRVNLVLPGIMPSKMTDSADMRDAVKENVLGRTNTLEEICRAIVFLSGLENVSGQTFNLDSRIF